jgi:hypothetical protein
MMDIFQNLLNKVRGKYKEADQALGGFLPGGGVGNPLSNAIKSINPQDVAAFPTARGLVGSAKTLTKKASEMVKSSPAATTLNQLPGLMDAASNKMRSLGYPGARSSFVPGKEVGVVRGNKQGVFVDIDNPIMELTGGPFYSSVNPALSIEEPTVKISSKNPGWVVAHELGHAVDAIKRPSAYKVPFDVDNINEVQKFVKKELLRGSSPGALVAGFGAIKNDDRSLLGAGIEGALAGLGASQQTLRREIMADRFGIPIAREAGVPWNTKQNMLAKGTYLAGAVVPGFGQGIASELISRGAGLIEAGIVDPLTRLALQKNKNTKLENQLEKYGYSPDKYKLTGSVDRQININPRSPMQSAVYNLFPLK